jgi:hypothetical protein
MRKIFSILALFVIVALCVTPLFFPNDAEAKEPPKVHASDLENTQPNAEPSVEEIEASYQRDTGIVDDAPAEPDTPAEPVPDDLTLWQRIFAYLRENTAESIIAIMAIIQVVVNLTPTEKDNGWFLWLRRIFDTIFPNLKKGGGTFEAKPKA